MCLVITVIAAVFTTALWHFKVSDERYMLSRLALMYWGAALMWMVDGACSLAEGGAFLELSQSDALLGVTVVFCGIAAWFGMVVRKNGLQKKQG